MKRLLRSLLLFGGYLLHRNNKSKVIYYHDMGKSYTEMGTPLDIINSHINIAREAGYTLVDNITQAEGQIMVCFDDGWKGIYDNKSFWISHNVFPTIFIAVDLIGTEGYMSVNQIKEMMSLGYQFESHAWTHTGLHTHTGDDLIHELLGAKVWLEDTFEKPFTGICFPQGNYNDEVIITSKRVGYSKLFSSINGGYFDLSERDGLICRNLVQDANEWQFKNIICGDTPLLRKKRVKQHYYIS